LTCAESRELLLDLSYGELEPERAAEVEAHLHSCAACQIEWKELQEMRLAAGPLRELEEPSAQFDEPILAAARTEASLVSDGLPGAVIEAVASSRPLGVAPTRVDTSARVVPAGPPRRKRWLLRAAFGGSLAAAAVLALVVSTQDSTRRSQPASEADYQIHVRTPADLEKEAAQRAHEEPAKKPQAEAELRRDRALLSPPPAPPAPARPAAPELSQRAPAPPAAESKPAAPPRAKSKRAARDEPASDEVLAERFRGSGGDGFDRAGGADRAAAAATGLGPSAGSAPSSVVAAAPEQPALKVPETAPLPGPLEEEAARRRLLGEYARAAALFRAAARARLDANSSDTRTTAWDLAHAVQCLASAGSFAEARQVSGELSRLFPRQADPIAAAGQALLHAPPAPAGP